MISCPFPGKVTNPTSSMSPSTVRVFRCIRVAKATVCFSRVYRWWGFAPQDILYFGYRFQMLWVDTGSVPTQMVYLQPFREMCQHLLAA